MSISGGILVGAIVGRERRLTADDDDDDEEQQHSNTVSGKEANADKTLEMIIRQLMVERDKSESV